MHGQRHRLLVGAVAAAAHARRPAGLQPARAPAPVSPAAADRPDAWPAGGPCVDECPSRALPAKEAGSARAPSHTPTSTAAPSERREPTDRRAFDLRIIHGGGAPPPARKGEAERGWKNTGPTAGRTAWTTASPEPCGPRVQRSTARGPIGAGSGMDDGDHLFAACACAASRHSFVVCPGALKSHDATPRSRQRRCPPPRMPSARPRSAFGTPAHPASARSGRPLPKRRACLARRGEAAFQAPPQTSGLAGAAR